MLPLSFGLLGCGLSLGNNPDTCVWVMVPEIDNLFKCWKFNKILFLKMFKIFDCAESLLLCQLFSGCIKLGLLCSRGAWACYCGGLSSGAQALLEHRL